ncbi:unnamed protein product, partial [Closterium sp. NIES-65]
TWEFDPAAGTEEERQEVERLREEFTRNRQERKHSSDALMRLQLTGGKPPANQLPPVRVAEEPVSTATAVDEATVEVTLRRAVRFYETIQAEDGHWAGDYGGPLFLMPGLQVLAAELANLFQLAAELASQTCSSWQQSSHRKPVPAGSRARKPVPAGSRARIANLFQLAAELASQTCSSWQQSSHRKPVPAGSRARIANLFQLAADLTSQT